MLLEGTIVELIVKLELKLYWNYIWRNKLDKPMLYVRLKRPYIGHSKQLCYFGGQIHQKKGVQTK